MTSPLSLDEHPAYPWTRRQRSESGDTTGSEGTTNGHVPVIVADVTAVLQRHGFRTINTGRIEELVQAHKEYFIEERLGTVAELRRRAVEQDDLVVIAALLRREVS